MTEMNDPAIKLFGRNISLPESIDEDLEEPPTTDLMDTSPKEIKMTEEICNIEDSDDEDGNPTSEGLETTSNEQQNTEGIDKNAEANKANAFKKPDKILPCPRCNSMETKFCYFNNYNVNQPRHFCRSCQRYWTAGGAIRNVPVGAGRRKSKHASPQLQPVVIPCNGGSFTQVNLINPDSPLCKSVTNKLTLEEPENFSEALTRKNETPQDMVHKEKVGSSGGGFSPFHTLQGFPGPPPWNFGWNGVAYGLVPLNAPTMAISPALCMPNIAFPFVPPMWGWDANTRNLSSNSSLSPGSCSENSGCSGITSSSLGKHSRDCNSQEEEKNEKSLWIPKTLRIADPEEAAKSSIWSTLGIKPGKNEPISTRGMFKAFQPRDEQNNERSEADEALKANPAALSRSKAFQENT